MQCPLFYMSPAAPKCMCTATSLLFDGSSHVSLHYSPAKSSSISRESLQVCKSCPLTCPLVPVLIRSTAQTTTIMTSAATRSSCTPGRGRPQHGSSRLPWTPPLTTLPSAPVLATSVCRCTSFCCDLIATCDNLLASYYMSSDSVETCVKFHQAGAAQGPALFMLHTPGCIVAMLFVSSSANSALFIASCHS